MFHKLKKMLPITNKETSPLIESYLERILTNPHHDWILNMPRYQKIISFLFESMPIHILKAFSKMDKNIAFIKANGQLSCALGSMNEYHVILVFPDLIQSLRSAAPMYGAAILAHELGHLYHNHSKRDITPLEAQFEADLFACQLGLENELLDVLLDHQESREAQLRIKEIAHYIKTKSIEM